MFIGGENDGRKGKARYFEPHLLASRAPELGETEKNDYGNSLLKVLDVMLGEKHAVLDESYVAGLGGLDYQNLPDLAAQIAAGNENSSKMTIRVVYGATEEMPLRALSYILPPLIFMGSMKKEGITPPQLQIIFANNISSRLDLLDLNKTQVQVQIFSSIAKDYIATFFPKLVESTVFLEDKPLEKGSVFRNELLRVASVLRNDLGEDVKEELLLKGKNNGAFRTYPFYGAAHLLIHDADIKGSLMPIFTDQPVSVSPDTIISFGGYQEQVFYKLRHALKPNLNSSYRDTKTLQYFTKHRVPPYYMARGGDVSLADTLMGKEESEIAVAAQHDIYYLQKVSLSRGDMQRFLEKQSKKFL